MSPLAIRLVPVAAPMLGVVNVLLLNVSTPAKVESVPVVGRVSVVVPVVVSVVACAPEVVRLPPRVIVLPVLATPVPPLAPGNTPVTVEVVSATVKPAPVAPPVKVPVLVKLEAVTPEARVDPESVPAAAVTVIGAVPSKSTPLIARAV